MAAGNELTLIGNVTSDVELKITKSGDAVASFGLAWNKRVQRDGEWVEEAHFFDVTVWKEQAENVTESVKKGDRVIVVGRLDQNRWEDKASGQNRSKVVVMADEVGVSLRWAEAKPVKNQKGDGRSAGRDSGRGGRDDYGDRGRSSGGRDSDAGRGRYDDEVPF
jgi:single-strand DNA-binding protein